MLSYTNKTYGDIIDVDLCPDGSFLCARRYTSHLRQDPITYHSLMSVPQPYRHEIEQLSYHHNRRTANGQPSTNSLVQ